MRLARIILAVCACVAVPVAGSAGDVDERALARITTGSLGLPPTPVPAENPPTVEKIALGRLKGLRSTLDRRFPEVEEFDRFVERRRANA